MLQLLEFNNHYCHGVYGRGEGEVLVYHWFLYYCFFFVYREKLEDIKRIREELRQKGCELPPLKPDSEHFDSNCITPVSKRA